jgi:hypothetical protein
LIERERILDEMERRLRREFEYYWGGGAPGARKAAEICLEVIEEPRESVEEHNAICTCGQSGYPENSPHSNHPHRDGCPQERRPFPTTTTKAVTVER